MKSKRHFLKGILFILMGFCLCLAPTKLNTNITELEKKLSKVEGIGKIDVLNELADLWYLQNVRKSIQYAQMAMELSRSIHYEIGEARALNRIGNGHFVLSRFDKALDFYSESLKISQRIQYKNGLTSVYNNMGNAYLKLGDYNLALDSYLKALNQGNQPEDRLTLAALCNVGTIYRRLEKPQKGLEYYLKALAGYEKINDQKGIAASACNLGSIYRELNQYDKALTYDLQALDMFEKMGDKRGVAITLGNMGGHYSALNDNQKALKYYLEAIEKFNEIDERSGYSHFLNLAGLLYLKQKKYNQALAYLEKALIIAQEIKDKQLIKKAYDNLAEYFVVQGDYKKAYEFFKKYHEIDKTIFNEQSNRQINELQEKYDTEKKEKQIEILKKNNDIRELRFQSQRLVKNIFIIGFILLFVILFLLFRKYQYFFTFWKRLKIVGAYRLAEKIGSGAVGTVFKAHSLVDKGEVAALKIMKDELFYDENNRKRFKHEAIIIDKFDHPHIVKIIERGEFKGTLFIAMELLTGQTLDRLIQLEGPLPVDVCIHLMRQITDALALIHAKNVIHRDLKPANIMIINQDGDRYFVKLMDFGLAKMEFQTRLTQTGNFVGTIEFIAPELILSSECATHSDIFSLGVTFYYIICGRTPFPGKNIIDVMGQILNKDPDAIIRIRPDIPTKLNDLVMKMLEKKPEKRPTAEMVLTVLKELLSH